MKAIVTPNMIGATQQRLDIATTFRVKPVQYTYSIPITSSNWKKTPVVPVTEKEEPHNEAATSSLLLIARLNDGKSRARTLAAQRERARVLNDDKH